MQAPYIYCYFDRTETGFVGNEVTGYTLENPSSCFMTAYWDWAADSYSNRVTTPQQVYRLQQDWRPNTSNLSEGNGYLLTISRSKVPGKGRALQLKFNSEDGKDFSLVGWAIVYEANTNV